MKVCVIQPPYSRDVSRADELFEAKLQLLAECDGTLDLIVLPEYSEVPVAISGSEETFALHDKYAERLHTACISAARRCNALVFVNCLTEEGGAYRNTTVVYDRKGSLVGKYFKKHIPPLEGAMRGVEERYAFYETEPFVLELEGLRFGFLTCYDFYFYEAFAKMAKEKLDIIIGCSLQRSDTHDAIEIMCRHLAYNTNTYVVRSSVSFAEDSEICGASMVVAPTGKVLCNLRGKFGRGEAEFDPTEKYLKPAGFGRADAPHYEYIEYGRRPWQYRVGGPNIVPFENQMPYPRICAHRGFSAVLPENSMPAFGAAIALGAQEIEFDLWPTKDDEIVSIHDPTLERVSTGAGNVRDHTLDELMQYDFGIKHGEEFTGLRIVKFEEILKQFAGQCIMNIHVKPLSFEVAYPRHLMEKIVSLVRKYECERHAYFMLESDIDIAEWRKFAPDIPVCVGNRMDRSFEIVNRAIELGAQKVQLFKPYFNQEMIDKAHAHGILCNVFWSDDPEEAKEFLKMGIDTILTNDYLRVSQILR